MTGSSPKLTTAREVEIYSFAEKVYHIHLRLKGDIDEVYFKNYLIDNPDIAKEYEELKIRLWKKYEFDRDTYTNAKTEFVQKYTKLAKLK